MKDTTLSTLQMGHDMMEVSKVIDTTRQIKFIKMDTARRDRCMNDSKKMFK